jgi:hypothetical protein
MKKVISEQNSLMMHKVHVRNKSVQRTHHQAALRKIVGEM